MADRPWPRQCAPVITVERRTEAPSERPASGWLPGPYPYAFGHAGGFGAVPPLQELEAQGWVRLAPVPGLTGMWVMKRALQDAAPHV